MELYKYFDYNATTPVDESVAELMSRIMKEEFANPSSFYSPASKVRDSIENARGQVAELVGAETCEIYFTSGGTEADNLAVNGFLKTVPDKNVHLITTSIEHPAVLNTFKKLEEDGYDVTFLPVDSSGLVSEEEFRNAVKPTTVFASVMHVNNEIGTVQKIKRLSEIAKESGVVFFSDGIQAAGRIDVDVKDLGVDMYSLSAHKMYGPKGVGALYIRKGLNIAPLVYGGGHEQGIRSGTENSTGIAGFGRAAEIAADKLVNEQRRLSELKIYLWKQINKSIPDLILNGDMENSVYNTLNVSVKFVEGEGILAMLDSDGFALSSGSACSAKSLEPSHVLLAIGREHAEAHGSLRISTGRFTTERSVDELVESLKPVIERLRAISPFKSK